MPKAFPREFREDVIRVYRASMPRCLDASMPRCLDASMAQVAKNFGISASCLKRWLVIVERKSSPRSSSEGESTELREANKRVRLLEQENDVLRRAAVYL